MEERKIELENLERRIFPPGRAVVHQDSGAGEGALAADQEATNQLVGVLDANFAKLKIATGKRDCLCVNYEGWCFFLIFILCFQGRAKLKKFCIVSYRRRKQDPG